MPDPVLSYPPASRNPARGHPAIPHHPCLSPARRREHLCRQPAATPRPAQLLPGGIALIVGYLGRPETCAAQIETVRRLPEAGGIESICQTAAQSGRLRLWMTSEPAFGAAAN